MNRVYITGLGCVTPLGNNIETLWEGLINGRCGIAPNAAPHRDTLPIHVAAEVKDFNPEEFDLDKGTVRRNDMYTLFALAAAHQAMADSGLQVGTDVEPMRIGCAVGSGIGGIKTFNNEHTKLMEEGTRHISPHFIPMMIANIGSANVAIKYNCQGPNLPVVTACATGTHAVGEAYRLIREGRADAMICGGAESAICDIALAGFNNMKALTQNEDPLSASVPFDARRKGFVMGEGAGILILESEECARKRGAKIYAEVSGYGNTCDAHHYTAPHPEGRNAAEAIRLAAEEAGFKPSEKMYINAHGTSTPLNDASETMAIKKALGEETARKVEISSTKSMLGHMLGAAGAVELIVCALAIKNGILPPTIGYKEPDPACDLDYIPNTARKSQVDITLSNSFGFGGQNACVALRRVK